MQTELKTPTYPELIVAYAHGKTIQFQDAELSMVGEAKDWNDLSADNIVVLPSLMRTDGKQSQRFNFRVKPRTVKIGDREVEAPVLTPSVGQELWRIDGRRACRFVYANTPSDKHLAHAGWLFRTEEAGLAAAKATAILLRGC